MSGDPFLRVTDLKVHFPTDDGVVRAVDGLTFSLEKGKTLGIVGESGSGKSVTSLAIMGLHRGSHARISGEILLDGQDLLKISNEELRGLRGRKLAMIFQDPLSAMHPYYTIGQQLTEAIQVHEKISKKAARTTVIEMLARVGIPNPGKRVDQYPHEFSGGMRQRAMIAMALINNPELLIADEPTTALDVTVQAQILDLMRDLQSEFGSAIIMITHDLGVVPKSRTTSWSCTAASASSTRRSTTRSTSPTTPTPGACSRPCHGWTGSGRSASCRWQETRRP